LIAALLATHKHPYVGVARMRLSLLTPAIVDMYASFWTNLVVLFRMTYWINKIKL
jgi:aspartyl/asparaginyl beta-hydroxylase (cupin superfamily)